MLAFANALESRKVTTSVRQTRGLDASAACGQLRNEFQKSPLLSDSNSQESENNVAVACWLLFKIIYHLSMIFKMLDEYFSQKMGSNIISAVALCRLVFRSCCWWVLTLIQWHTGWRLYGCNFFLYFKASLPVFDMQMIAYQGFMMLNLIVVLKVETINCTYYLCNGMGKPSRIENLRRIGPPPSCNDNS